MVFLIIFEEEVKKFFFKGVFIKEFLFGKKYFRYIL